jgi:hypothetical protein
MVAADDNWLLLQFFDFDVEQQGRRQQQTCYRSAFLFVLLLAVGNGLISFLLGVQWGPEQSIKNSTDSH